MALELGQPTPDFSLQNQHGERVCVADYRGKKNVVVVFYPFAFSSVCTGELIEIRDNVTDLRNDTSELLAVSCDPMFALRSFADRDGLAFPLLSDFWPHGEVARAYGVFNEQLGCAGRATFILDRDGVLKWQVWNQIPQARDLGAYRTVLAELA